jgi:Zn-dependent protease with chaperone function
VYGLHMTLGTAGLVATAVAVGAGASSVHIAARSGHHLAVAGQQFTYPAVNAAAAILLTLAVLGAAVIIVAMRTGWRQVHATRAFLSELRIIGPLEGYPTVHVIDDHAPQAFCAGYVRPRVYVSTGALHLLSEAELQAVLAHEHHHRDVHDPLRLAWGRVLAQALFFMPVLRRLHDRYGDLAELTADAAALEAGNGSTESLASALLAFGTQDSDDVVGISPERVDSLLGRSRPWELPALLVLAAVAAIAALVVLVWRTSGAASAHATFNLPVVTSQPCILVLALLPALACAAAMTTRHPDARARRRRPPTDRH